jgi:hypothetical protein
MARSLAQLDKQFHPFPTVRHGSQIEPLPVFKAGNSSRSHTVLGSVLSW